MSSTSAETTSTPHATPDPSRLTDAWADIEETLTVLACELWVAGQDERAQLVEEMHRRVLWLRSEGAGLTRDAVTAALRLDGELRGRAPAREVMVDRITRRDVDANGVRYLGAQATTWREAHSASAAEVHRLHGGGDDCTWRDCPNECCEASRRRAALAQDAGLGVAPSATATPADTSDAADHVRAVTL